MNRKLIIILLAIAVLTLSVSCILIHVGADFGDFSGDSDYGGSDWGDSDWGDSDWGSDSSGSYAFGRPLTTAELLLLIFVVMPMFGLPIILSITTARKYRQTPGKQTGVSSNTSSDKLKPIKNYVSIDPNFDESVLIEKISNLYVQLQTCWTNRDIEPVRPYFTDALFTRFQIQVDEMKKQNRINYVERIAVLDVSILGYRQTKAYDFITAEVKTRIVDYSVNEKTGKLISGSKTAEKFMTYKWVLKRSKGFVTLLGDGIKTVSCPNCAAPLDINVSARCEYCGSVVNTNKHSWAICDMKGISQRTVRK